MDSGSRIVYEAISFIHFCSFCVTNRVQELSAKRLGQDGSRCELLATLVGESSPPAAPLQHGIPDCKQRLQTRGFRVPEGKIAG